MAAPARAERGTVRLMSWNIDSLVYAPAFAWRAKAQNVVRLVVENDISVLALQEVSEGQLKELRRAFCSDERVRGWDIEAAETGEAVPTDEEEGGAGAKAVEYHAFAFDTARATLLRGPHAVTQGNAAAFRRPPVLAQLTLRGQGRDTLCVLLCSVHMRSKDVEARAEVRKFGELVWPVLQAEHGESVRSLILIGDVNLAPRLGLAPEPEGAFARLQFAGWRHVNEAATNLAVLAGEPKVFDNAWCSPAMTAALAPHGDALSAVIDLDGDAFRSWLAEHLPEAVDASREELQTAAFADVRTAFEDALWTERYRAEHGPYAVAPQPNVRMPTKWFSHGRGWSDHRPLYITLRIDAAAAAALAPPPAMLERHPTEAELIAQAADLSNLAAELGALGLDDEAALSPALRRLTAQISERARGTAQAAQRIADANAAAAAAAVRAAAEAAAEAARREAKKAERAARKLRYMAQRVRCCAFEVGTSGLPCSSTLDREHYELPEGSGRWWCSKVWHKDQGVKEAAAARAARAAAAAAAPAAAEQQAPAAGGAAAAAAAALEPAEEVEEVERAPAKEPAPDADNQTDPDTD